jgi:hypothetical protein
MAGSVSGLHVFAGDVGPEQLSLLDGNYNILATQVESLISFGNNYIDSGAVNNLVVTVPAPQIFAYVDGITLLVKIAATNTTTTPVINVNALGAKAIVNPDGSALAIGALVTSGWALLQYEGTSGKFQLLGGGGGATGIGKFADGSAPNPSITFGSDLTLGLYKAGADILGISTAGVSRGTIDASGHWVLPAVSSGQVLSINTQTSLAGLLINSNINTASLINLDVNSVLMAQIGSVGLAGQIVVGSAAGDLALVTGGARVLFGGSSYAAVGPTAGTLVDMTPDTGTFTITYTGMTAAVTGTATWSRVGKLVTLYLPSATGTSNSASFTMTGLPAAITPATLTQRLAVAQHALFDNGGGLGDATIQIATSGLITCYLAGNSGTWTAAGTKGAGSQFTVSYLLN